MNIITDNTEGRVHITELGCTSEVRTHFFKISIEQIHYSYIYQMHSNIKVEVQ